MPRLYLVEQSKEENPICPACDTGTATESMVDDTICYGQAESAVNIEVRIPVWTCNACGFQFTNEFAETIRHDAICGHLGVMTPGDIQRKRISLNMSQQEFATLAGVGVASVKRWETGSVIQNRSLDNLLKVIDMPEVRDRLANRKPDRKPSFKTVLSEEQRNMANVFELRQAQTEAQA